MNSTPLSFDDLPSFDAEGASLAEDKKALLIEALKEIAPECLKEGELNLDHLKIALGEAIENEDETALFERYELSWAGKTEAKRITTQRSSATLVPYKKDSEQWDTTQNLFIEGDNLEVLKVLKDTYAGKVDMVYIDPPYNIDVDGVYEDDYSEPLQAYLKRTGQVDETGHITDSAGSQNRGSGRKHSRWLSMMYPRLQLLKQLLKQGG